MTKDEALKLALEELEYHTAQTRPIEQTNEAITAIKEALAQPEQEPVAYINVDKRSLEWASPTRWFTPTVAMMERVALYTSPQPAQRKPLTDEQIRDLWSWSMTAEAERTANTQQHAFARAIEAAHSIKEKTHEQDTD